MEQESTRSPGEGHGPLLVFADAPHHADIYARHRGLAPGQWRYVRSMADVLGRHGGRYVVLAGPDRYKAWDAAEFRADAIAYLRSHGFTEESR